MVRQNNSDFKVPGYNKIKLIGTGARSEIWQVIHNQTGRTFALKRTTINTKFDKRFLEQSRNEYRILQEINHPNIRNIYAIREIRTFLSVREVRLLMQFCQGFSVKERPPATLVETCVIFAQTAAIMHDINAAGFVHADMKPGNIIVTESGKISVIDFGQSCKIGTVKERIQGTPDFMAPEQINRGPLNNRTDVYNFGATLYWALTGENPPAHIFTTSLVPGRKDIQHPHEINPEIPRSLDMLTIKCLEPDPAKRPATMLSVAKTMGGILKRDFRLQPSG